MTNASFDRARQSLSQIFAIPTLLGVLTTVGLVSALVGDGVFDGLSWLTLAAPVAIPVWCLARASTGSRTTTPSAD